MNFEEMSGWMDYNGWLAVVVVVVKLSSYEFAGEMVGIGWLVGLNWMECGLDWIG